MEDVQSFILTGIRAAEDTPVRTSNERLRSEPQILGIFPCAVDMAGKCFNVVHSSFGAPSAVRLQRPERAS